MHVSRFSRPALGALGSAVVFALALTSPGCGGASGQSETVVPKERPIVSAKDSMADYLKSHTAQAHASRRAKK
jgi:hypothetical protein